MTFSYLMSLTLNFFRPDCELLMATRVPPPHPCVKWQHLWCLLQPHWGAAFWSSPQWPDMQISLWIQALECFLSALEALTRTVCSHFMTVIDLWMWCILRMAKCFSKKKKKVHGTRWVWFNFNMTISTWKEQIFVVGPQLTSSVLYIVSFIISPGTKRYSRAVEISQFLINEKFNLGNNFVNYLIIQISEANIAFSLSNMNTCCFLSCAW